jgi:large conductance mechanosensitive channel
MARDGDLSMSNDATHTPGVGSYPASLAKTLEAKVGEVTSRVGIEPTALENLRPMVDNVKRYVPQDALAQIQRLLPTGNLVDMTAGVLIGGAVGGTTNSLIHDLITPTVSLIKAVATGAPLMTGSIHWVTFVGSLANCCLVTAIAAAGLGAYRRIIPAPPATTQTCRFCLSEVPAQAVRCRYCTSDLAVSATVPAATYQEQAARVW